MSEIIETPDQAKQDPTYFQALKELLFQLADDDLLIAFRGSEWLGLAPHIEEDVAYSSITQNTMGHAVMYYNLLEALGVGKADILAHDRKPSERRNGSYLEKRNGEGTYLEEPYYDWALAVVRNYFYETFKKIKLEAIANSSYQPLAHVARKVLMEHPYHLAHWRIWMRQLQGATEEAKKRIQDRVEEAWNEFADVLELGALEADMRKHQLIMISAEELKAKWLEEVNNVLRETPQSPLQQKYGNGRNGEHTGDLEQALDTLAEVYNSDKTAAW
ncbi:phenylacetate-CoA oxygenase subunit PaaC [Ornithinibacillus sp. BX22]|uniref:Phenylacetate-CoA oxygenase subunit PaaC n=2 Tax=Ornithinibacillus TaxID=484508 RepID=A0A923L2X2_9BACI|nr:MULTISPECIES: 1,2-phenylacetyl-CoA epoxidase subunit PaaC [Ornithinibacillus]MBC5635471.1 phenylacetate-CoA oxygenase subunit PaaC [Ornithinibacillus hominis]MBS3679081.1 phenylacetate-CoA oxygenase subunit PaaC [Ornithinibacillus massiliensis]